MNPDDQKSKVGKALGGFFGDMDKKSAARPDLTRGQIIDTAVAGRNGDQSRAIAERERLNDVGVADRWQKQRDGVAARNSQWAGKAGSGSAVGGATPAGSRVGAASASAPIAKSPSTSYGGGNGPSQIDSWPKAFRPIAAKVNELCEWWGGLKAGPGISITKSKGATIISLQGGKNGSGGGPATELHFNDGTISIDIDANGAKVTKLSNGHYAWLTPNGWFQFFDGGSGEVNINSDGLQIWNGTTACEIFFSALSGGHHLSVRTIDVCDSGTPKYMDIVGSAPYT